MKQIFRKTTKVAIPAAVLLSGLVVGHQRAQAGPVTCAVPVACKLTTCSLRSEECKMTDPTPEQGLDKKTEQTGDYSSDKVGTQCGTRFTGSIFSSTCPKLAGGCGGAKPKGPCQ